MRTVPVTLNARELQRLRALQQAVVQSQANYTHYVQALCDRGEVDAEHVVRAEVQEGQIMFTVEED